MTRHTRIWLTLSIVSTVLTAVFFSMGSYPALTQAMAPDKPFDEKPVRTFDEAKKRFQELSEEARLHYRSHLAWDVPFFLSIGLASASLLLLAWGPGRAAKTHALILNFTAMFVICDAAENFLLATWFSNDGPSQISSQSLAIITPVKFASLLLTLPVLLVGIGFRIRRRRTGSDEQQPTDA